MRTRALVVTARMPWPLDDGGRIGLWQQVWTVSREFETTLVSLETPERMSELPPLPLRDLGIEIVRVPHRVPPMALTLLKGMVGPWPYTLARYRNAGLDATLRRLVAERRPGFAMVNHLHLATYVDALEGTAVVLREHNLEFRWLERYGASLANPAARAYAMHQARRMREVEADLCTRCQLVLAIQNEEAAELKRIAPRAWIEVVPIGVDFSRFSFPAPASPPVVLLMASLGWPPNAEGARIFLREGWPRVRSHIPGVRLRLVGRNMPADLAALARASGAEPIGYADEAAREFAIASALVVPLWAGAGARVKIVEALAARVPVVSTSLGAEGLELKMGTHFLAGDTAAELGDALARLLAEPARASAMAAAGREFARTHFSLDAVAARTNGLCARAAERPLAHPAQSIGSRP